MTSLHPSRSLTILDRRAWASQNLEVCLHGPARHLFPRVHVLHSGHLYRPIHPSFLYQVLHPFRNDHLDRAAGVEERVGKEVVEVIERLHCGVGKEQKEADY